MHIQIWLPMLHLPLRPTEPLKRMLLPYHLPQAANASNHDANLADTAPFDFKQHAMDDVPIDTVDTADHKASDKINA